MKKKIILIAVALVLLCGTVSAADLGHIGVSNKGLGSVVVTWKDGLADGLNMNIGFGYNSLYLGGQWYLAGAPLVEDWLCWHAGLGAHGYIGNSMMAGGEVFAGLDFYPGAAFNINLPLEIFLDYGIGLNFWMSGAHAGFAPDFVNFSAGIRWMFD